MNNGGGAPIPQNGTTLTAIGKGKTRPGRKHLSGLAGALLSILPGPGKGTRRFEGLLTRLKGQSLGQGLQATHKRAVAGSVSSSTSGKPQVTVANQGSVRPGKAKTVSQALSEASLHTSGMEGVARTVPLTHQNGIHPAKAIAEGASPAGSSATVSVQPGSSEGQPVKGTRAGLIPATGGKPQNVGSRSTTGSQQSGQGVIKPANLRSSTVSQRPGKPPVAAGSPATPGLAQQAESPATSAGNLTKGQSGQGVISEPKDIPAAVLSPPASTSPKGVPSVATSKPKAQFVPTGTNATPAVTPDRIDNMVTGTQTGQEITAQKSVVDSGSDAVAQTSAKTAAQKPVVDASPGAVAQTGDKAVVMPLNNGIRPTNEPERSVNPKKAPTWMTDRTIRRTDHSNTSTLARDVNRVAQATTTTVPGTNPQVQSQAARNPVWQQSRPARQLQSKPAIRPGMDRTVDPVGSPRGEQPPGIHALRADSPTQARNLVMGKTPSMSQPVKAVPEAALHQVPAGTQRKPAVVDSQQPVLPGASVTVKAIVERTGQLRASRQSRSQSPIGVQPPSAGRVRMSPAQPQNGATAAVKLRRAERTPIVITRENASTSSSQSGTDRISIIPRAAKPVASGNGDRLVQDPLKVQTGSGKRPIATGSTRLNPARITTDNTTPAQSQNGADRVKKVIPRVAQAAIPLKGDSNEPQALKAPDRNIGRPQPAVQTRLNQTVIIGDKATPAQPQNGADQVGKVIPQEAQPAIPLKAGSSEPGSHQVAPQNMVRSQSTGNAKVDFSDTRVIRGTDNTTQSPRVDNPTGNPTPVTTGKAVPESNLGEINTAKVLTQDNSELPPVMAQRPQTPVNRRSKAGKRPSSRLAKGRVPGVRASVVQPAIKEPIPGTAEAARKEGSNQPANNLTGNNQSPGSRPDTVQELSDFASQVKVGTQGLGENGRPEPAVPMTPLHTTPAPKPVALELPIQPAQFARLTAQQYHRFAQAGQTGKEFSFEAGAMGNVRLTFSESAAGITLHVVVESSQAQQQLYRALPTIEAEFVDLGLKFGDVSVEVGDTGEDNRFTLRPDQRRDPALPAGVDDSIPVEIVTGIRDFGYNTVEFVA